LEFYETVGFLVPWNLAINYMFG